MSNSKNITKEILEDLYLKQRLNIKECGEKLSWSAPTVVKYLKYFNIPIKSMGEIKTNKNLTKENLENPHITQQLSIINCSEILGCKSKTIKKYLQLYNIPIRIEKIYKGKYKLCATCGKEFYICKSNLNKIYCSMDCYNKIGTNNPMYNKQQSEKCRQVNSELHTGNKYNLGRPSLHITLLNKSRIGLPIKDETKIKLHESSLKYWQSEKGIQQKIILSKISREWANNHPEKLIEAGKKGHKACPRISSLEKKIQIVLEQNSIDFISQYEYKLGFVDFLIKPNIALFVNGNYWHNYPEGTEKDKRQIEYLQDNGYKPLVIWEHEFKNLDDLTYKIKSFVEIENISI